jgi:hypothetical protein
MFVSEADEDHARALWRRYLELDVITVHPLPVDDAATRAELACRGERTPPRSRRPHRMPSW